MSVIQDFTRSNIKPASIFDYWAHNNHNANDAMTVNQALHALNKLKALGHGDLELHVVYKGESRAAAISDEQYVIVHELDNNYKGSLADAPDGHKFIPIYVD